MATCFLFDNPSIAGSRGSAFIFKSGLLHFLHAAALMFLRFRLLLLLLRSSSSSDDEEEEEEDEIER